jgi:hypothetical protein
MSARVVLCYFVLSALFLLTSSAAGYSQQSVPVQACVFQVIAAAPTPTATGPADIVRRVHFLPQTAAPLRIIRIDFTGASLAIGGSLKFYDKYALEVMNVSNQVVTLIHPFVQTLTSDGGPRGGGPIVRVAIAPGERRWLRNAGQVAEGAAPTEDDVRIRVSIAAVTLDGCTWEDRRWADGFRTVSAKEK